MQKWWVYLLILLVLDSIAFSDAESDKIFYSDSLLLDLKLDSAFTLEGSGNAIEYAKADMYFFPEDSGTQEVMSLDTIPLAERFDDYLEFYWANPQYDKYSYEIESKVRTLNSIFPIKAKIKFPITSLDPSAREYLQKTAKIDIDDEIIKKASSLAEGEDDLSVVAYKLASWTKQNINYSITTATADASQKASWVLKNRYGVCDELTNLFIAFCRSLGIPARFVSGVSYTNSELFTSEWGLHGWAEVYFPGYGWIPYDPTYGQFGYIDAGHIKLKDSLDSDKSSSKFEWQGSGVNLNPLPTDISVDVLEYGKRIPEYSTITTAPLGKDVGFGSYNLIEAKFKNLKDYYVAFESTFSSTNEITKISQATQSIILPPNSEKSLYWIVQVSQNLDKNYVYTFPYEISTSLGSSKKSSFTSTNSGLRYSYSQIQKIYENMQEKETKKFAGSVAFNCSYPRSIYANETFTVFCNAENTGNIFLKAVNMCIDDSCTLLDIGISQTKNATFRKKMNSIGAQKIIASAKNKDAASFMQYELIVEDLPGISIENVQYPEMLNYEEFDISFELGKKSLSSPKNVDIIFSFNGRETTWTLPEMEANQKFTVSLDPSSLNSDKNSVEVIVKYKDRNDVSYTVSKQADIPLGNINFLQKILIWINTQGRKVESLFV